MGGSCYTSIREPKIDRTMERRKISRENEKHPSRFIEIK
jgi:hypothetical protein